jgi:hypothetical protein
MLASSGEDCPHNEQVAVTILLLSSVRKAPASNLDRDTQYPDWGFRGFLQYLNKNVGIVSQIRPQALTFSSTFTIHPVI